MTSVSVTQTGFTDSSPSGTSSLIVTKRIVLDGAVSLLSSSDILGTEGYAFGSVLSPLTTLSDSTINGRMRLRSTQLIAVPGSEGKMIDAIGRYDSMYVWCVVPTLGSALHLPVETDVDATPRSVVAFRSSSSTVPTADLNTTTDIGGTKLDYGGKPVQTTVWQQTLRLSLIIDSSRFPLTAVFDRVATHQGKWNSAIFLHWGIGNVFCESASISHIRDEYYRATYLFRSDYWMGCDQQPKIDVWGKAEIGPDGAASTVTWKSIVYGSIDHNLIFNDQPNATVAKQWAKEGSFLTYP
jgi:hypothetical protein